jgi:hypothetical protein
MKPEVIDLFLDESRVESRRCCNFITCAVAVISERWVSMRAKERDFRSHGTGNRLQRITRLLETANGIAVLTEAKVDTALLPACEIDSTSDIPQMSRTDNVWSICFLFCIAHAVTILHRAGLRSYELNIYHDPKELKKAHWQAIRQAIESNIVHACIESAEKYNTKIDRLGIKAIEEVQKAKHSETLDIRQSGVAVADYLCGKIGDLLNEGPQAAMRKRIFIRDQTKMVTDTLAENWPLK